MNRRRYVRVGVLAVFGALVLLFALLSSTALAAPTEDPVTVQVNDSHGNGLPGVTIRYQCNSGSINYFGAGPTDANGQVTGTLPDGASCRVEADYRNTSASQTLNISDPTTFTFQTSAVTVTLSDHSGGPLAGGTVAYKSGSTIYLNGSGSSTTNGTGAIEGQLFNGTYDFRMQYNTGTEWENGVTISGNTTVPFQTGLLSIVYSNDLAFGQGNPNSTFFTKAGTELLPGTYLFNPHGSGCSPLSIDAPAAGTSATKSIFAAHLVDSSNNPLAGGSASYYAGGWYTLGTTDANGWACKVVDGSLGNISVAMVYNGTRQQLPPQNVATNSIFNFQTTLVSVKLEDHLGNPIDTGSASYYAGGWYTIGDTSSGQVQLQMLPGSYSFAMVYNNSRQQLDGQSIAATPTDVVFQTGQVTLYYSGSISWYYGSFHNFAKPSMEFLPGTTTFYFDGYGCQAPIAIASGDDLVKSVVSATLKNHAGANLAGGDASAYVGGWQSIGTTNGYGTACKLFDGHLGNVSVAMVYGGTRQQITQNQPTNSVYAFHTELVTLQLKNSSGALIDTGTGSYYAGGWHDLGNTSGGQITLEMLPGTYSFAMVYQGERNQVSQNIAASPTVVFQTEAVTLQLKNSSGALIDTGTGSYYAGGWHDLGNTSGGQITLEMLPGTYSFAMVYQGERNQVSQDIATNPTVVFQTEAVTLQLKNSSGSLIDTGTGSYYAGGWHDLGSTTGGQITLEMLPGTYSFAMVYQGERNQVSQNIAANPTVVFQTDLVTIKLVDHTGANGLDGGTASYYAGGWHDLGNTSGGQVQLEMLPGSYSFAMVYQGTRQQLNGQNVASNVVFETGQVHDTSGTATSYYAGGWKTFTQDMELLPGTYTFHFSNSALNGNKTITAGTVNDIP